MASMAPSLSNPSSTQIRIRGVPSNSSSTNSTPRMTSIPPAAPRPSRTLSSSFSGTTPKVPKALSVNSQRPSSRSVTTTRSMWIDNKADVAVGIGVEDAFKMWEDRERIPNWMPWIESVKVQPKQPELSRWTLRWQAFFQNIELTWLARNLTPTPNQKIQWRSVDGFPNRGTVRFYKTGPRSCRIQMTISYEVPGFLLPFAAGLGPLVEGILKGDLDRFARYAREQGHGLKELKAS